MNRGRFRHLDCRTCHLAHWRPLKRAYRAAHRDHILAQEYRRRRRDRYLPNRVLGSAIDAARRRKQERETKVGMYALVRATFAVPEDRALP